MSHPKGAEAGVMALRQAAQAAKEGLSVEQYSIEHNEELRLAVAHFEKPVISI